MNIYRFLIGKRVAAPFVYAALVTALSFVPAGLVLAQDGGGISSVLGQLTSESQASTDATLKSLGGDLATKAQALSTSFAGNPQLQTQLTTALESVMGNKGPEAVAAFQKLSAAKLTPDQVKLAKDVGHVGSAYLVQKNLGSLDGSQSDVAEIVTSLRQGNVTTALPAIKRVSQNVNITPEQKNLLTSMAEKFAPGAKQASDAISNGLKGLSGFGK